MGVIEVTGAAYAHPGGVELFDEVTFRVGTGQHVALIGPNGVGKSTLLRCVAGELALTDGGARTDAPVAYMPQAIGTDADAATVRDLLLRFSPPAVRNEGIALAATEHANDAHHTAATGQTLAAAVVGWGEVGGYDHERRWDKVTRRVLRQPLDAAAARPVSQLSGGERKRLVLELLLEGDVPILLLDEPDNFLDIAGKRWLERRIAQSPKTLLFVSHDRELLAAAAQAIVTVEGAGCWTHPGSYGTYTEARDARNETLGDALARWKAEERRLFAHYKTMKQRAALNDGNARRADAAEHRWRRFVDAGPPPAPPTEHHARVRLAGSRTGKRALRCRRLAIAGLTDPFDLELSGANLLLLDEPTDNLDLATSEALETALAGFTGTVITVTHDRWFMRGFDRYLVFGDDCSVREALDLDTALHAVTGDPAYPFSPAALVAPVVS